MYLKDVTITGDVQEDAISHKPGDGEVSILAIDALDTIRIGLNDEDVSAQRVCSLCSQQLDDNEPTLVLGEDEPEPCPGNMDGDNHEPTPVALAWAKNVTVSLDEEGDAINLIIATGDPRGGFTMTVRRTPDGQMIMHLPYPGMNNPHEELTLLHEGTYKIG